MILLHDVVRVFVLAHNDVDTGVSPYTFDGRRIGAALVDGDLLRHAVQVDGTLQKAPNSGLISLGGEQKINRVSSAINGTVDSVGVPVDRGTDFTFSDRSLRPSSPFALQWER